MAHQRVKVVVLRQDFTRAECQTPHPRASLRATMESKIRERPSSINGRVELDCMQNLLANKPMKGHRSVKPLLTSKLEQSSSKLNSHHLTHSTRNLSKTYSRSTRHFNSSYKNCKARQQRVKLLSQRFSRRYRKTL